MFRTLVAALLMPSLATGSAPARLAATPLKVGVYYFPGWTDSASWASIATYPDKRPLIGWYDSGRVTVMTHQLHAMERAGINYVAFDWYWDGDHVHADQAVRAYLQVPQRNVSFSLLWANDRPTSTDQWRNIVQYWIDNYFVSRKYLKVDDKPVVFVLSYQSLSTSATANHTTVQAYVSTAQAMARSAGLPGLYLVADTDDLSTAIVTDQAPKEGFSAVSAYNLHRLPWLGERPGWSKLTEGYPALDHAYRANWVDGFDGPLSVVVPMMSGWDRRPWGGSADPKHDRSIATPAQFRQHLAAARATMLAHGQRGRLGVICCWNEFGEGSYVESTAGEGTSKLDIIRQVFGVAHK